MMKRFRFLRFGFLVGCFFFAVGGSMRLPSAHLRLLERGWTDRQATLFLRKIPDTEAALALVTQFERDISLTRERIIYLCITYPVELLNPPANPPTPSCEASHGWCWHRKYLCSFCRAGDYYPKSLCGTRPLYPAWKHQEEAPSPGSSLLHAFLKPSSRAVLSLDSEFSPWRVAIVASFQPTAGEPPSPVLLLDALIVSGDSPPRDTRAALGKAFRRVLPTDLLIMPRLDQGTSAAASTPSLAASSEPPPRRRSPAAAAAAAAADPDRFATAADVRALLQAWIGEPQSGGAGALLVGHTLAADLSRLYGSESAAWGALPRGRVVDVARQHAGASDANAAAPDSSSALETRPKYKKLRNKKKSMKSQQRQQQQRQQHQSVMSLKAQCQGALGVNIQDSRLRHCPVEDALASLALYYTYLAEKKHENEANKDTGG